MRYTVKRVHGWKTYRVWDEKRKDWEGAPFATQEEADAECALFNKEREFRV